MITDADTRLHPAAYRLTRIGEIMTRQRLSLADVRHLQRGLRLDHLAWLDLLLVAATSPDFPSMPTLTEDARGRIAQTLTTLHSALITTTPLPDLLENSSDDTGTAHRGAGRSSARLLRNPWLDTPTNCCPPGYGGLAR